MEEIKMGILYGIKIKDVELLNGFAKSNELATVKFKDQHFLGTIITLKSCFRDNEVLQLINDKESNKWHPRFISHLREVVRASTGDDINDSDVRFFTFESLGSKVNDYNPKNNDDSLIISELPLAPYEEFRKHLSDLEWTEKKFIKETGISEKYFHQINNGEIRYDLDEVASLLQLVFLTEKSYWINLEKNYQIYLNTL
jgi:plasmid maintenance system antidote protein VapI